jgi:hypothetical protein
MRMILGRSLTPLNVKSLKTSQVRRTPDQTVCRRDDNSRRRVQNVPADSRDDPHAIKDSIQAAVRHAGKIGRDMVALPRSCQR